MMYILLILQILISLLLCIKLYFIIQLCQLLSIFRFWDSNKHEYNIILMFYIQLITILIIKTVK